MARTLKPEVVPFSSEEIRIKKLVFRTGVAVKGRVDLMSKIRARCPRKEVSFRTAVDVTRCIEIVAETPGKSGVEFSDKKLTDAFQLNSTEHRSPVKENTLRRNPSKKLSKPLICFLHPPF